MVSILPPKISPLQAVGQAINQFAQNPPKPIQQAYERQISTEALNQAQKDIEAANGDPYKIALAFARAGAVTPNLERSLGPLVQTAMQQGITQRAFPGGPGINPAMAAQAGGGAIQPQGQQPLAQPQGQPQPILRQAEPSTFATPSPFNVMTAQDINAESQRYAQVTNNPANYAVRQQQLNNQNQIATEQRANLEDMALKSGIKPAELPRFLEVGSKFDTRNPAEWMLNTGRAYNSVKTNDKKIENAFIPGIGNALIGQNRDKALKNLIPTVQDQIARGLEQETRNYLVDQYLTPTEIEGLVHPLSPQKESAIKKVPKGFFPLNEEAEITTKRGFPERITPFISYEEALEKAPKELQQLQNILTDFFLNNVDKDTSLLQLRDKLVHDRDYDWRQIGPAIREAMNKGLKLEPFQSTEMTELESQAPYDSLGDIFQSLDRVVRYLRGNR